MMKSHTMSEEHGSHKGAHGKFHKGAALKKSGHHGLIGSGKHHGGKAAHLGPKLMKGHGKAGGSLIATPANVGKLGHKGA